TRSRMSINVNLLIASKFGGCLLFFGGPVEDRRNNRRLATVTGGCLLFFLLYSPNLVAVSFSPSGRIPLLPVRLFSGGRRRAFLRRRGLVDDSGQKIRQAPTRVARAGRKLGHLGKAELRIGKRQSALGLLGRRHERVLLV